jgi:epoxyqueuosine reductase QueG
MVSAEKIIQTVILKNSRGVFWTVPITLLKRRERDFFSAFSPEARTAVVLGHHIVTRDEWTWYLNEDGLEHSDADDQVKNTGDRIREALANHGFRADIVPYPGESGLQFRSVAEAAGVGRIGINKFLLHPAWGPWIHLRVLATDAPSRGRRICHPPVCDACGACITACPAGAIQEDSFDGLGCRRYRTEKGEYIPSGPDKELRYCTICADVCPVGQNPRPRGPKQE